MGEPAHRESQDVDKKEELTRGDKSARLSFMYDYLITRGFNLPPMSNANLPIHGNYHSCAFLLLQWHNFYPTTKQLLFQKTLCIRLASQCTSKRLLS